MNLNKFVSAGLVAAAVFAAPAAQAAYVIGSASVTSFFEANNPSGVPTSLVSLLTSFDVRANATVGATFGSLFPTSGIGTATDFTIGTVPQLMFQFDGFSFTVNDWGPVQTTAFSCAKDQCSDGLGFSATGAVVGNGFDSTQFTMSWSAQGSCNENLSLRGQCGPNSGTASYSASISATGVPPTVQAVPEPGSLALAGLALLGVVASTRRKSA